MEGMPSGRIFPFALGMYTLRTGQATNVPDLREFWSPWTGRSA
jgi:hypothetical protein